MLAIRFGKAQSAGSVPGMAKTALLTGDGAAQSERGYQYKLRQSTYYFKQAGR